jgi:hypothetical protein
MRDVVAAQRVGELIGLTDAVALLPDLLEADDVGSEPLERRGDCGLAGCPRTEPPPEVPGHDR